MLLAFAALCALAVYLFLTIPQGFVPDEDQGYLMTLIELPDASTITRTEEIVTQVNDAALGTPGVFATVAIAGYNIVDGIQQPNAGIAFIVLQPWDERTTPETSAPGDPRRLAGEVRPDPGRQRDRRERAADHGAERDRRLHLRAPGPQRCGHPGARRGDAQPGRAGQPSGPS